MRIRAADRYRLIAVFHLIDLIAAVANDSAYIRAACHGGAVHDIIYVRIAEHCARETAHDVAAGDGAADEGDVIHDRIVDHAEKTDMARAFPADIEIENVVVQTVKLAVNPYLSLFVSRTLYRQRLR